MYLPPLMATIKPFPALRPKPDLAARICALPYDVMSSEEARELAADNPLSFLHVSKPEIDLPPGTDLYAPEVYAKGRENFQRLIAQGALRRDTQECFYLYRQVMGQQVQLGLAAAASCEEYLTGVIKKHELTRLDKEDDRVRHIEALGAQTGPVFLVYRSNPVLDQLFSAKAAGTPEVDFTAEDGVRHTAWVLGQQADIDRVQQEMARLPALYIADGHHRCAAAARIYRSGEKMVSALPGADKEAKAFFLAVLFPHTQVHILAYNRVLKDLNGRSPEQLLEQLDGIFVMDAPYPRGQRDPAPPRRHQLSLYLSGQWRSLHFRPRFAATTDPLEKLDVSLLQKYVLEPIFGIEDPRTSKRVNFVGGIRGTPELERLVDSGEYACAFALFPTGIDELMAIADQGGIMPPKSTWFEPKLRDAMFCHLLMFWPVFPTARKRSSTTTLLLSTACCVKETLQKTPNLG